MEESWLLLDKAWFHASVTARDSQSLNNVGPCLILAGAGMCNGGRILHHLRHGLPRDNTHVLIVGYQAQGSMGRRLIDRAKSVSIFGEKISARARVNTLGGFSADAGQSDRLKWFTPLCRDQRIGRNARSAQCCACRSNFQWVSHILERLNPVVP
jgi:metallo-beta-lactamase family protein